MHLFDTVTPKNYEKENLLIRDTKIAKAKLTANLCCFENVSDKNIIFQSNSIVFNGN